MKGKCFETAGPLGPWLVTPDEIPDVDNLAMWTEVNGERRQSGSTANMIFKMPALLAYVSQFMVLEPGDVVTTGTPPAWRSDEAAGVARGRRRDPHGHRCAWRAAPARGAVPDVIGDELRASPGRVQFRCLPPRRALPCRLDLRAIEVIADLGPSAHAPQGPSQRVAHAPQPLEQLQLVLALPIVVLRGALQPVDHRTDEADLREQDEDGVEALHALSWRPRLAEAVRIAPDLPLQPVEAPLQALRHLVLMAAHEGGERRVAAGVRARASSTQRTPPLSASALASRASTTRAPRPSSASSASR